MVKSGIVLSMQVLNNNIIIIITNNASIEVGITSVTANQAGSVMSRVLQTFHN